jgi:hypothetical protein
VSFKAIPSPLQFTENKGLSTKDVNSIAKFDKFLSYSVPRTLRHQVS